MKEKHTRTHTHLVVYIECWPLAASLVEAVSSCRGSCQKRRIEILSARHTHTERARERGTQMRQIHRHIHTFVAHTSSNTHVAHKPHSIVFVAEAICRLFSCSNYLETFLYFSFSSAACNTATERGKETRQTLLNNVGSKQHLKLTQKRHKDSHRGPFYAAGSNPIFTRVKF